MSERVEIDGLRELHHALGKYEPELRKKLRREFKAIADTVAADARSRAPRRTGKLAKSIKARSNAKGAAIVSKAPYARITEFGGRHRVFGRDVWVNQPATPFLRPAVEAHRDSVRQRAEDAIRATAKELNL